MSFRALVWAKDARTGSATCKLVLLTLAEYADDQGASYPSQRTLAHDTELSVRTIRNALTDLEDLGLLKREEQHRKNGSQTVDRITLCVGPPPAGAAAPPGRSCRPTRTTI